MTDVTSTPAELINSAESADNEFQAIGDATYSPEDNKLRLYPYSRLDTKTYSRVKAAGFKWAPKQELFVAPMWTPSREDLLIELCGEIGDEDYSPEERAADRAERFAGYRDKRRNEAGGLADRFDDGPAAFGHQNRARAERQAARHDRLRVGAVNQWSKAEYWQDRTKAVISHALYKSSPKVRRGRILELESDLRKVIANYTPHEPRQEYTDSSDGVVYVLCGPKGRGSHYVAVNRLESLQCGYSRWVDHYNLRLEYERAMLAEEGGSAAEVEMEPGGWIGGHQIQSVNKSPVTGRVVSVKIWVQSTGYTAESNYTKRETKPRLATRNIERLGEAAYRPPTDEERAQFQAEKKAAKAAKVTIPTINPTDEDAQRLQDYLNGKSKSAPRPLERITQSFYSRNSGGECMYSIQKMNIGGTAFKLRMRHRGFYDYSAADSVVVLTDKPQKPLPVDWSKVDAATPAVESPELATV